MELTEEMEGMEWCGYLLGEVDGNTAEIKDIFIPKQVAYFGTVRIDHTSLKGLENIIGTVHSHGGSSGKPSPSSSDANTLMSNHPVTLIVGKPYYCSMKVALPCNKSYSAPAKLEIIPPASAREFVAMAMLSITIPQEEKPQGHLPFLQGTYPFQQGLHPFLEDPWEGYPYGGR